MSRWFSLIGMILAVVVLPLGSAQVTAQEEPEKKEENAEKREKESSEEEPSGEKETEEEKEEEAEAEDKTERLKAPGGVAASVRNMLKLKGLLFTEAFSAGFRRSTLEGEMKKDFCKMTGNTEVYNRRNITLIKDKGGRFAPPDKVTGEEEKRDIMARSPVAFYSMISACARSAVWMDEEELDDVACRVLECRADAKMMKEQVKEYCSSGRVGREFGFFDMADFVDYEQTTSIFKVWIGKEDLRIYKILWNLDPVAKDNAIPGGRPGMGRPDLRAGESASAVEYTFTFREHDEEPEIDIPAVIRSKLKVK